MKILITGAAGYIGSHVMYALIDRGYDDLYAIDRHLTTSPNGLRHLTLSGWHNGDILGDDASEFLETDFDVIIHLAADISVEESMKSPVKYWRNNLLSTNKIIENCRDAHLIFASTGTAFCPENHYALTKVACEEEVRERVDNYTIFRFYNVSGLRFGLHPTGTPTHLIRRAAMAAAGLLPAITVFGTDWDTPDGTCVRDYIHAIDLANSIVNAIEAGPANTPYECLGSGTGFSVKDVLTSMKRVSGVDFRVTMAERRAGDVASMICPSQYKHILIEHDLDSMCHSAYQGMK